MSSLYPSAALPWTSDLKSLVAIKGDESVLKTSVIMILLTEVGGERVMRNDFGSNLLRMVFEPGDSVAMGEIRNMVVGGIQRWDPRIQIVDFQSQMKDNEMVIRIALKNVKDPRETSPVLLDFSLTPNGVSMNR